MPWRSEASEGTVSLGVSLVRQLLRSRVTKVCVIVGCVVAVAVLINELVWQRFVGSEYTREMGLSTSTAVNAGRIARALMLYVEANDGRFPKPFRTEADLRRVLPKSVIESRFRTLNPNGGTFVPNASLEGKRLADMIHGEAPIVVFFETRDWPKGGRVCGLSDGYSDRFASIPGLAGER